MSGPTDRQALTPAFRVKVNGSELPVDAALDVTRVTIDQDVDQPGMCDLDMLNWDDHHRRVTWVDDQMFALGAEIAVELGYVDHLEKLFTGELVGVEPRFSSDHAPRVTIRAFDRLHRLLRGRKSRTYLNATDKQIVELIAGDHGLTPQAEDSGLTYAHVYQHNQTDLEFLRIRAARINYEIAVDDKTLNFRSRRNTGSEALTLGRDEDLRHFDVRLSSANAVTAVTVRGWNPDTKKELVGHASAGDIAGAMGGSANGPQSAGKAFGQAETFDLDTPLSSQAEADAIAKARLSELALEWVTGQGTAIGRTDLRAGVVIKIEGLGDRFTGLYYVVSATHTFSPHDGYKTIFKVKRNSS